MKKSYFLIGFGSGLAGSALIDGIWWLVLIGLGALILGITFVGGKREDG